MLLVEIHNISKVDKYFEMLDEFCFKAKNLYNNALYHIKQYYLYKTKLESGESIENLNVPKEIISYMKDEVCSNIIAQKIIPYAYVEDNENKEYLMFMKAIELLG